jgi:hypothetical protein
MAKGHGPPVDCKSLTQYATTVVQLYTQSVIVIDGLDEFPVQLRGILLNFITALASTSRILISSRKEVDIEDELKDFPTISLDDEQINLKEDMRKLINEEFENKKKWTRRFQVMKDEIMESLILGSGKNM